VPYLTIQKEADVFESPEYLRIKQENQILQAEIARHVVERSELQDLKDDYDALKADLDLASTLKQHEIEAAVTKQMREF
jgi:cell shape-determining protein MreC